MNKVYRSVYKDGIGIVPIAENASCLGSRNSVAGSMAKVVKKFKSFFDCRNEIAKANGFLLKGLFVATLFCTPFVPNLNAGSYPNIQDNGTRILLL